MIPNNRAVDDSKHRCWCDVHVEKAAYIVAFVGSVLCFLLAVLYFIGGNIGYGIGSLLNFFVYFTIILAQRQRSPNWYLPFLILNGIAVCFYVGYIIAVIFIYLSMPYWYLDPIREDWRRRGYYYREWEFRQIVRVWLGVYGVGTLVFTAMSALFYSWVWRAYEFMKDQNKQMKPRQAYYAQQP
ncbi:hypothetical protein DdX_01849 [Ditylenchus destructor]|uniref:Uncharacterized protein n=1 Tax=Ditylenchus destructor TaxID=166010 RepID=A0AAD4NLA3_9BILA|nr:hypothetical protein DdX_01849 [Ditylenchus destructor]